ncbi:BppU family phage baseplate upper protein [Bacillus thuringiensis]|uniref:BppU family phage baseplate upper protein n=1 Tax=Bacillus thuringiensis TaxID=1428 RepID=UPI0020C3C6BC|nr:BppU family phage baseplate upper protein [Bacillus thuringiensis]
MKTKLILDVNKTQHAQLNSIVTGRVGDKVSNVADVYLIDGGSPYNLTGSKVFFECVKPDNTFVRDDKGVKITDAAKGHFEYTFPVETFGSPGKAKQSFFSIEKDKTVRATTQDFVLVTLPDAQTGNIPSESYVSELEDIIKDATDIVERASGSPKGVFATLADLKAAFPKGDYGIYIVSADGKWYYWNGTTWTAGGIYQSTGILENSITPEKTNFLIAGKNLFNKDATTKDVFLSPAGGLISSTLYQVSDFILVKEGQQYTLNSCRHYCLYDTNKGFLSYFDNSSQNPVTVRVNLTGFLRATIINTKVETFQIERGASVTSYEAYNLKINYLEQPLTPRVTTLESDVQNIKTNPPDVKNKAITYEKTNFLVIGKNMFNKDATIKDSFLSPTGGLISSTSYQVSDYMPVKAAEQLAINAGCRHYCLYDKDKKFLTYFSNDLSQPIILTPAEDGYMRISILNTNVQTVQVEKGAASTAYELYSLNFPQLGLTSEVEAIQQRLSSDLVIVKSGDTITITSPYDGTKNITIETIRNGSNNGAFKFNKTTIGTDSIHPNFDDITPIRTFSTVGANHGYTTVVVVTMENHGKTTSDLGSKWTDGVTTYTLLDIKGNDIVYGCPYTLTDGVVSSQRVVPIATLTHVSGATNTTNIDISNLTARQELFPSINNISTKYILDGKGITADGTYYGDELQIQESYNIMDYKSIIDFAQGNIGQSYKQDSIEGVVRLSVNYTITKGCNCLVSHNIKALKKVSLTACGFIQSAALSLAGHTLKRYMPGVTEKNGYDFKTLVDMTSYASDILFYPTNFTRPNIPPNRYVDWLYNGANKKYGFTMGYIIDKTNSKTSDVLAQNGGNYYWDMRSTKKSYPTAINVKTLNPGEYKTFLAYRNYLTPTDATIINVVEDKRDTYVYVDYHQDVVGKNIPLSKHIGKNITVLDSQNFTLLNTVVDSDGVTFNISGGYGFAVLKLT